MKFIIGKDCESRYKFIVREFGIAKSILQWFHLLGTEVTIRLITDTNKDIYFEIQKGNKRFYPIKTDCDWWRIKRVPIRWQPQYQIVTITLKEGLTVASLVDTWEKQLESIKMINYHPHFNSQA